MAQKIQILFIDAADRVDLRLPALSVGDVVMESARHAVSMHGHTGLRPANRPALAALRARDRRAVSGGIPESAAQRPPARQGSVPVPRLAAHRHRRAAPSPQVATG